MVDWNGLAYTQSWSTEGVFSDGIGIIQGRIAANGQGPIIINALHLWAAGRGGARQMYGTLGGASGTWSVGAGNGAAVESGWFPTNNWFVPNGGSTRISMASGGNKQYFFGRSNTGFTANAVTGYQWTPAGAIFGGYGYVQAPNAPVINYVTPHPNASGAIIINFSGSTDNGGTAVTNYRVYRNGQLFLNTTNGYVVDSGLNPSVSYNYYVTADNAVTDAAGTTSVISNQASAIAPGNPSPPQNLTVTPSTNTYGKVTLNWQAPALSPNGPVTGYTVQYTAVGGGTTVVNIGNTLTYDATGLGSQVTYDFTVSARNDFSDRNNQTSFASNKVTATSPGPPSAPRNLSAIASTSVAGRVDLSWTAPADLAGGVTRYSVYYATDELIQYTTSTSLQLNNLIPGSTYQFYIRAWNTAADNAGGPPGPKSNIATATATGDPSAPLNLTVVPSAVVPGRLILNWSASTGSPTGYVIYAVAGDVITPIGQSVSTTYRFSDLTPNRTYTYAVAATNAVTDAKGTTGSRSSSVSATPSNDSVQSVNNYTVSNLTNSDLNGTFTVTNVATPTSVTYGKAGADFTRRDVSTGTVVNKTGSDLNGSYTITVTSSSSFTYPVTSADLAASSIAVGTVTNSTNELFNGVYTVSAVNTAAKTISYNRIGANVASRATGGTVTNNSNVIFNGTGLTILTKPDVFTFTYAKTNANIPLTTAAGTATNTTNSSIYNGIRTVVEVPSYNQLVVAVSATADRTANHADTTDDIARTISRGTLNLVYRSGWAG